MNNSNINYYNDSLVIINNFLCICFLKNSEDFKTTAMDSESVGIGNHAELRTEDSEDVDMDELERLEQMRKSLLAQLENSDDEEEQEQWEVEDEEEKRQEISMMGGSVKEEGKSADVLGEVSHEDGMKKQSQYGSDEQIDNTSQELLEQSSSEDEEDAGNDEEEGEDDQQQGWTSEEELLERELMEADSEQIDSLLEQPIDQENQHQPKEALSKPKSKKFKRILEYRGTDHFNILPDGWVEITHTSGLPVFLHKPTRVCTFSRPYFIGRSSIRNHKVPESAIPCLFQKKYQAEIEKAIHGESDAKENAIETAGCPIDGTSQEKSLDDNGDSKNGVLMAQINRPNAKVKTEADSQKTQLTPDQLYDYAKDRFKFKEICILKFGKWMERRKYQNRKKMHQVLLNQHQQNKQQMQAMQQKTGNRNNIQRPGLPSGLKLITIPALEVESKPHKRPFYLNPQGKTSVSILHEFVQKALKCTVRYFFSETRSSSTPYHCVVKLVLINNAPPSIGTKRRNCPVAANKTNNDQHSPLNHSADIIRQKLAHIYEFNRRQQQQQIVNGQTPTTSKTIENTGRTPEMALTDPEDPEFITIGEGFGAGKKNAKLLAAKDAVDKLVPDIEFDKDGIAQTGGKRKMEENGYGNLSLVPGTVADESLTSANTSVNANAGSGGGGADDSYYLFDMIGVTDTRVPELCARAGQPSPYLILQEYLKRYSAFGDTQINLTSLRLRHQRHEFQLSVGEHTVKVVSGNKREAKQMAAQALLKKLHPNNDTWGSILRLYGYEAQQKFREARKNKDSVVKLQSSSKDDSKAEATKGQFQPNELILDKLRAEMMKLSEQLVHDEINCQKDQKEHHEGEEPPPIKIRRVEFSADLPILSEEQLKQLSANLAAKRPELQRCIPSVRF